MNEKTKTKAQANASERAACGRKGLWPQRSRDGRCGMNHACATQWRRGPVCGELSGASCAGAGLVIVGRSGRTRWYGSSRRARAEGTCVGDESRRMSLGGPMRGQRGCIVPLPDRLTPSFSSWGQGSPCTSFLKGTGRHLAKRVRWAFRGQCEEVWLEGGGMLHAPNEGIIVYFDPRGADPDSPSR